MIIILISLLIASVINYTCIATDAVFIESITLLVILNKKEDAKQKINVKNHLAYIVGEFVLFIT